METVKVADGLLLTRTVESDMFLHAEMDMSSGAIDLSRIEMPIVRETFMDWLGPNSLKRQWFR